jgi:hypothetical protein
MYICGYHTCINSLQEVILETEFDGEKTAFTMKQVRQYHYICSL